MVVQNMMEFTKLQVVFIVYLPEIILTVMKLEIGENKNIIRLQYYQHI